MIITCKNCGIKYHLIYKEENLAGKTLKCTQCEYTWLYKAKNLRPRVRHDILHLRALRQNPARLYSKNPQWLATTAMALFCTIILFSIVLFQDFWIKNIPITARPYEMIGLPTIQGCIINNAHVLKNKDHLEVSGAIKNTSITTRQLPILKITLYYKDERESRALLLWPSTQYLSSQEQYFFSKKISTSYRGVKSLSIEILNVPEAIFYKLLSIAH